MATAADDLVISSERALEKADEAAEDFEDLLVQMDTPVVSEIPDSLLREDELVDYLDFEIYTAKGEREEYIKKLARWQEVYDAPREEDAKKWPFKGAANLKVPVVKEVVNTLTSQLLQTILTPRPTWVLRNLAEEWDPFKGLLERFLDTAARREFDFNDVVEDWVLEGTKYGTSILEVGYDFEEQKRYIQSANGEEYIAKKEVVKDGPELFNVPLEDFFTRTYEQDIQDANWVAKRMRMSEPELKSRAMSGLFRKEEVKDLIIARRTDEDEDEVTEKHETLEEIEPTSREEYTVFEAWVSWNLDDGDDIETEILVYWVPETRAVLSARFHPFWHNKRPFVKFVYFPVEHRFYGEGICEQLEALQEEISEIHNQRLDNATLANIRGVVVRRMAKALKPGDTLYPGIVIEADDPVRDVMPFQMAEVYPSTYQNEQVARNYVERVSGVSEAQSAGAMPVTRTTATAQALLLQEGAKRFDQTIRKLREGIGDIGELVLRLYFQFGAGDKPVLWMGKKGEVVNGIFSLPKRASELGIGIEASAPTSRLNKEAQRQNSLALFNLMVQLYKEIIPLAAQMAPDELPAVVAGLVNSAKQFMFQVLEQFDVTNPEDVLAGLTVLQRVLPNPEDLGGMESFRSGEETARIFDQLGELEDLLRETPRGDNGGRTSAQSGEDLRRFLREQRISRSAGQGGAPSPFAARREGEPASEGGLRGGGG